MPILESGALDDKKPRALINYPSDPVDGLSFASSIEDIKKTTRLRSAICEKDDLEPKAGSVNSQGQRPRIHNVSAPQ
jgi:hypothetical protein